MCRLFEATGFITFATAAAGRQHSGSRVIFGNGGVGAQRRGSVRVGPPGVGVEAGGGRQEPVDIRGLSLKQGLGVEGRRSPHWALLGGAVSAGLVQPQH